MIGRFRLLHQTRSQSLLRRFWVERIASRKGRTKIGERLAENVQFLGQFANILDRAIFWQFRRVIMRSFISTCRCRFPWTLSQSTTMESDLSNLNESFEDITLDGTKLLNFFRLLLLLQRHRNDYFLSIFFCVYRQSTLLLNTKEISFFQTWFNSYIQSKRASCP